MKNDKKTNRFNSWSLWLIVGLVVLGGGVVRAEPMHFNMPVRHRNDYVPGQVVVQYKKYVTESSALYRTHSMNHMLIRKARYGNPHKGPLHLVQIAEGESIVSAIAAYKRNPDVEYAHPNYIYRATVAPIDTGYSQLWGMHNTGQSITGNTYSTSNPGTSGSDIDAELAWNVITDCSSVTVAVIDTGVNYNHEDLASNMATGSYSCPSGTGTYGCDFVGAGGPDPLDLDGHGTHVAGTIGAVGNNGKGVAGVCWKARILAVRVLDANGGAGLDIAEGINFAVAQGVKVINMSLGGAGDPTIDAAITSAQTNGIVVVVAAGNSAYDHNTTHSYPCDYSQDNLVCVAAADQSYSRASFTDYDTNATASSRNVDIAGPGTNIRSAFPLQSVTYQYFDTGWTVSPAGGWGYSSGCSRDAFYAIPVFQNPGSGTTWCSYGTPGNNRTDIAYRTFDLSAYSSYSTLTVSMAENLMLGADDSFSFNLKSTGGDPFSGGSNVFTYTGLALPGYYLDTVDLTGCKTATCSMGFRYQTGATTNSAGDGVSLAQFLVFEGKKLDNVSYGIENGTSMASPHVAGIATMVRARNPNFTYTDTINAILTGGDAAPAFAGYTKTGMTANAFGALKYIPDTVLTSVTSP